ncbi:MAG: protein-S-isoprenylcysteine O-methyltransferase Ste14 [Oceanospirillaceae bacterium]|jgi:protein-S-isoprenylcysteine O-methyltransferase Ste14
MNEDKKGAAVKFPPPLIFVISMGLAITLNRYYPQPLFPAFAFLKYMALISFLIGGVVAISAVLGLHFAKTSVEPWKPTLCIVDKGVFAYSRNPIYLSFVLVGISVAFYLNSLWVLISLMPATFFLLVFVISKEERYLLEKFGDEYTQYCNQVRRWL